MPPDQPTCSFQRYNSIDRRRADRAFPAYSAPALASWQRHGKNHHNNNGGAVSLPALCRPSSLVFCLLIPFNLKPNNHSRSLARFDHRHPKPFTTLANRLLCFATDPTLSSQFCRPTTGRLLHSFHLSVRPMFACWPGALDADGYCSCTTAVNTLAFRPIHDRSRSSNATDWPSRDDHCREGSSPGVFDGRAAQTARFIIGAEAARMDREA